MDIEIDDGIVWKTWSVIVSIIILSTVVLSVIFPRKFYDQFIWKYFWGPIVADAHGVSQVERLSGETYIPSSGLDSGVIAEPGYTIVSTVTYAILLVFGLIGVVIMLNKLDFEFKRETVISFVPFMIFGGLIRVAEDMNVFVYIRTDQFIVPFPYSSLVISPIIYFVLFGLGLSVLVMGEKVSKHGYTPTKEVAIATFGVLLTVLTTGWFVVVALLNEAVNPNISVLVVTLTISTVLTAVTYYIFSNYTDVMSGVGKSGFFLIWAHMLDGFANVISLDWLNALGIQAQYRTKHVVNEMVRIITETIQPEWLTEAIGVTWPFIIVKLGIVVFLLWVLNEEFFDESRKLAVLTLLVGIAVGLGPATRDIARVTLGI